MSKRDTVTRDEAIEQIAAQLDGPIALDEFVERVLALWPSRAKRPQTGVRQAIRSEHQGEALLFLDDQTLIPTRIAMPGIRFHVPLARQEVDRGWLFVYPSIQFMMRADVTAEAIQLTDSGGHSILAPIITHKTKVQSIFGSHVEEHIAFDLGWWYKKQKVRRNDSLIVTVIDWETGQFRLQHEPARERKRRRAEIQRRNQELAGALFDTLESSRYEYVFGSVAIPTAYARLRDHGAYLADHWYDVIKQDSRMRWAGYEIRYADWVSPLEGIVGDIRSPQRPAKVSRKSLSKRQAQPVYRFKASFKYRKGLWRRIEIQGGQTLADFDAILRSAFEHDRMDHVSGFWQLVRRGKSRRFREVDLGSINPFGEGEAADVPIATLALEPGAALKYVYDFGDWIQHRIELEEIIEPEAGVDYPRIVAQNRPRYKYCRHCAEEGRKTVATRICQKCSEQEAVLVCDTCARTHHEDHYTNEILY